MTLRDQNTLETPPLPTALSGQNCKVKRCKEPVVGSSTTGEGHVCNLHNIREWGRALANPKNPLGDRGLGQSLLADARDLQAGLDDAQARLQTTVIPGQIDIEGRTMTDDQPAKRTKNPSYTVLEATGEDGTWKLVKASVSAPSRKAAISAATPDGGTFLVIPDKECKAITRRTKQLTVDEFE